VPEVRIRIYNRNNWFLPWELGLGFLSRKINTLGYIPLANKYAHLAASGDPIFTHHLTGTEPKAIKPFMAGLRADAARMLFNRITSYLWWVLYR
jgi:hypothetical protein